MVTVTRSATGLFPKVPASQAKATQIVAAARPGTIRIFQVLDYTGAVGYSLVDPSVVPPTNLFPNAAAVRTFAGAAAAAFFFPPSEYELIGAPGIVGNFPASSLLSARVTGITAAVSTDDSGAIIGSSLSLTVPIHFVQLQVYYQNFGTKATDVFFRIVWDEEVSSIAQQVPAPSARPEVIPPPGT